jgi:hypothetical protein
MPKFKIVYSVDLDSPEGIDPRVEAYYWHMRSLTNPDEELPKHVYWVKTVPDIQEEAL